MFCSCKLQSSTDCCQIVAAVFFSLSNVQADLRPSTHCPFANLALWPKKVCAPLLYRVVSHNQQPVLELRGAQGGPAPLVLLRAPLDAMTKWG